MRTEAVIIPGAFRVRTARPGDARGLRDLTRAVAAEGRWIRTQRVTRSVWSYRRQTVDAWSEEGAYLVAEAEGRVVGSLRITREAHPVTRHVASFGMHVAAPWRGRGVGGALLAEAIRWAEGVGVRKIELSVYPHNDAAKALYERFGFREEGRLLRHSLKEDGFLDEVLMGRWLGEEP